MQNKKRVLTSTAPAASAISTGTVLLLLVDLFGLGYFDFALEHHTHEKEHYSIINKSQHKYMGLVMDVTMYAECAMCSYLASTDVVVFLLHNLLDGSLFFIRDEYESPPLFRLWILWKFNGLDLYKNF